jgi:hypothetical protein
MPVPYVPRRVLSYLRAFNSIAIAITRKGKVVTTSNPSGCETAWWLASKVDAKRVLDEAQAKGDIEASAKRLRITLTPHPVALMKADRALARLDAILRAAQQSGDLQTFNRQYACRRQAAISTGKTFMPYTVARLKLQRSLMSVIADGIQGRPFQFAMVAVFEDATRGPATPTGASEP